MGQEDFSIQTPIVENLKKGIIELLILSFLNQKEMHIYAIINSLDEVSDGACRISFPYGAIYRLLNNGYIVETGKKVDENRLRQFYGITEKGKIYLTQMRNDYDIFISGVNKIFLSLESEEK